MGLNLTYLKGQTPLDEEEKDALLIAAISTREELDEFEQQNIESAIVWLLKRSLKPEIIFSEKFIRELHLRMYGDVWAWAGEFRKTEKNIGVKRWQISTELKNLCDDALFWVRNHTYEADEIAIRFKHRLVCIHCFPNGNGRHSRLMADIIAEQIFGRTFFSWGAAQKEQHKIRESYLKAIKEASKGDYESLVKFARS